MPAPAREYARTLGEIPRLRAEIEAPAGARWWRGGDAREVLCDGDFLTARAAASRALYPMPESETTGPGGLPGDTRFQMQVWWYSTCNSWMGPTAASIVVQGRAPRPGWDGLTVFERDDYWLGYAADEFVDLGVEAGLEPGDPETADDVRALGAEVGRMIEPVVAASGEELGVRPAPLWAIAADALAGASVAAGNEIMEPWAGALVGSWLVEGLGEVTPMPAPRFVDVDAGLGAEGVTSTDLDAAAAGEQADFDVVTHLNRMSCCMIYRSPKAGLCVSCPRRSAAERRELWAGA
ncbi:(2Fe-2S)-binding protein [uncultured Corynebacterium sp.]|uniref:(2Fe-2S)-binding protein n=1 Tax=uncultured Corynebacterium sp. TaxID=159447 RepID=UPI0025DA2482|nr:(2Fe-2S)-binding protein [uncultured Corynebacterium sp.]